jgi:signal transduction histidine kinase
MEHQGSLPAQRDAETTVDVARRVLEEQVCLLYRPAIPLVVNAVNTLIVAGVLWAQFPVLVPIWAGLMTAVLAGRVLLRRAYRASPVAADTAVWARRHALGAGLTGLLWGATAAVLAFPVLPVYQLFACLVIAGMSAGAVAALSFHMPSLLAFIVPCILPAVAVLATHGEPTVAGLAAMGLVFLLALIGLARTLNGALIQALRLRFENASLVKELREAQDMAQSMDRSSWEMLAHLSHELRTPLNAIAGFAEVMRRQLFGPLGHRKYGDYAKDIADSTRHLVALVEDILRYSRGYTGSLTLEESVLDPRVEIEACVTMVTEAARDSEIEIVREIADDLPLLRADAVKLRQILVNLLSNGIKFTPAGGRVTVSAAVDDRDALSVVVADTGIGIEEKDLRRVLLPYVQVGSVMTRTRSGLGLGLPLAKRLIEMQGGTLSLASTPGEGTRVAVRFPAERSVRGAAISGER